MNRRDLGRLAVGAASVLAAPCALAAPQGAPPSTPKKLFAEGPLSKNAIAASWSVPPTELAAPNVQLLGDTGPHRFSQLKGAVRIVSLWAEWCTPCLLEAHDLAELRRRSHDARFDILGIAQGTKLDVEHSHALLAKYGAAELPTWLEPKGASIAMALATPPGARGFTLPCNLLVDRHGRIRGRAFGSHLLEEPAPSSLGPGAHPDLSRLIGRPTIWSTPAADAFVEALKQGALDHV